MPRIILIFSLACTLFCNSAFAGLKSIDQMALESICQGPVNTANLPAGFEENICNIIVKSSLCEGHPNHLKRNCSKNDETHLAEDLFSCVKGAITSIKDLYETVKNVVIFLKDNASSEEKRDQTKDEIKAYSENIMLYFETEVEKEASQLSGPFKETRASFNIAKSLLEKAFSIIGDWLSSQYAELACLNEEGKVQKTCETITSIFFPPAAFGALISKGPKAIKALLSGTKSLMADAKIKKFPKLSETHLALTTKIPYVEKINHPREIPFDNSKYARAVDTETMLKRAEELDPEMRDAITGVYNSLNDPVILDAYYKKLFLETAERMYQKGRPEDLKLLEEGLISKQALNVTLVKRFKERGDDKFTTLIPKNGKYLSFGKQDINVQDVAVENDAFRMAIKNGPFIDKAIFDGSRIDHGAFTHLIQRDILTDVLKDVTKGSPQKFWDYMGSKKGVNWWGALFDSTDSKSMTSPETINAFINHEMMISSKSMLEP